MAWIMVLVAGGFEVLFAISIKETHGFTRPLWIVVLCISGACSFGILAFAVRTLPIGAAYAVWTGIGAAGAVALGIALFNESSSPGKLVSIALILIGIVGLQFYEH